ncbi:nucleotide pyrophosphohydrolase [Vibrio phage qdvp001]|uniref:nucleotide pyrophosphohydrolase n=1 Tax=Vibrio phage qdvp001 TaxID=1003177 RepID=UPI0007205C8E|nr:nucleotide pyrophosphohydrolase [Vibrio phage qdvp001]ALM62081.1 hypothetical protein qdvp001_089 [Vibrio phage qdvp001]
MEKKEFTRRHFDAIIHDVVQWNKIGGNEVEDKSLIPIYTQLSREEMFGQNEFLQGWFTGDKVMQADGVGDLLFTVGMLCELTDSPEDFQVNTKEWKNLFTTEDVISLLSSSLINVEDYYELREHLFALCVKMSEIMDVEGVFRVISDSNYSKYVHEDMLYHGFDLEGEVGFIESRGRYGDVNYKKVGNYYVFTAGKDLESGVVFDKPKIIKSSLYHEPEGLEKFIY